MSNNQPSSTKPRRILAYLNLLGTTQLHLRNPYVIAFWSVMFPGFGHLLLSRYIRAYILFFWEIYINLVSHINLAIFFTLLGNFDSAKQVVDIRWSLIYIPTYVFAVWDSYRSTVDMNKQYILASRENAPIEAFVMKPLGVSFLDKRSPFVTAAWCGATPGLGHIMLQRIMHGVFVLFWWIVVVYFSNVLTALHLTCFGEFKMARDALDPQWFLNIPSLLFFCVYTTYVNSVESNKLFDLEQSDFLRKNYQSAEFPFSISKIGETGADMYVISTFDQTIQVELAVTALEEEGIPKKNILAASIEKQSQSKKLFDTMRSTTGESVFDLPMILGALFALFCSIYGFLLSWGPVVWGVIGGFAGFVLGFIIKLLVLKRKKTPGFENEVVIFVSCEKSKAQSVKKLLQDSGATGVNLIKADAV